MLDDWRAEGIDLPSRAVVAGPRDLLLLLGATQVIFPVECRLVEYSSKATDLERDERAALNTVLQGYTGEAAERVVELGENVFEASRARRLRLLGEISTDAGPLIETYGVTHVLAESGVTPKGVPARFRLRRVAQGRTMDLWRIDPRPLGPARGSADESSK
jgi:hypothetical protein